MDKKMKLIVKLATCGAVVALFASASVASAAGRAHVRKPRHVMSHPIYVAKVPKAEPIVQPDWEREPWFYRQR